MTPGARLSSIELQDVQQAPGYQNAARASVFKDTITEPHYPPVQASSEESAIRLQQRWNSPRSNMWRSFAAFYSFLVLGLAAASYGALIPYIEPYYGLSYAVISLIFLTPFPGYLISAVSTHLVHQRFGQRGIAVLGGAAHVVTFLVIALHPPFPVVVVMFAIQGFGHGIIDSAWNAWLADMSNAHQIMGFLHGSFGLGGVLGPLISTAMITKAGLEWYHFYYVMVGLAVIESITCISAFWNSNGESFRAAHAHAPGEGQAVNKKPLREVTLMLPNARVSWTCSLLLWIYIGTEISLGGWIVTFMLRERHGGGFASGMTATGFWLGLTVGRLILGFVTPRIGERLAITIYLLLSAGLSLIFWLVPSFIVSAVAAGLEGFFLGPVFPSAIVATTKLLPKHLHVTAVSFISAVGSSGGAIWPFIVGAIAQAKGVQTLQPIILSLLLFMVGVWAALPKLPKKADSGDINGYRRKKTEGKHIKHSLCMMKKS